MLMSMRQKEGREGALHGRHSVAPPPPPRRTRTPGAGWTGEREGETQAASILESGRGGELSVTDPSRN